MKTVRQIPGKCKTVISLLLLLGMLVSSLDGDMLLQAMAKEAGSQILASSEAPTETEAIIVDSRFRYEPMLQDFDVQVFLESRSSGLATYVFPSNESGPGRPSDIIKAIAIQNGIAPQVLLVMMQIGSGVVDEVHPAAVQLERPMGLPAEFALGFQEQIEFVAKRLDGSAPRYYESDVMNTREITLADEPPIYIGAGKSPTAALLEIARLTSTDIQRREVFAHSFTSLYREYYFIDPLIYPEELSADLSAARLPFAGSKRYTGGPHGGGTTSSCAPIAIGSGSGIDFSRNTTNDPEDWEVLSILAGTLLSRDSNLGGGIGNRIRIKHSDSLVSEYWHLAKFSTEIQGKNIGDTLPQGFPVGYAGKSGSQSAIHLHLELRTPEGTPVQWDGETIDGYSIGFHQLFSDQSRGYNYQGSAVLGGTKRKQITASCGSTGSNFALTGLNYNNSNEQNGVDPNTIFADTRFDSNAGRVVSTNSRNLGPNVVTNGSFELPVVTDFSFHSYFKDQTFGGWTVESGSIDHISPRYWQAADGGQSVDLNGTCAVGTGVIYQDLITEPQQTYLLSFALAGNPDGQPPIKQLEVWGDNTLITTVIFDTTGHSRQSMGWSLHQSTMTAADNVTRLRFKSLTPGCYGPVLDKVSLQPYTIDNTHESGSTVGVFRPSNGVIFLKNSNSSGFADIALNYGLAGDYPVVGDWDGDGDDTIGVYRGNTFLLRNSNTVGFANLSFTFGQAGDQPIAGDWDGDGVDTIGIYRPSTGQFLLRNSNSAGSADISFYLGNVGDIGIAGDWNGDGIDTTGVFRPSNGVIFLKNQNQTGFADIALNYGLAGDKPIVGDWDTNGTTTIGVYRNGKFYLRNSNTNGYADIVLALGIPGDMPIAGNWDGVP